MVTRVALAGKQLTGCPSATSDTHAADTDKNGCHSVKEATGGMGGGLFACSKQTVFLTYYYSASTPHQLTHRLASEPLCLLFPVWHQADTEVWELSQFHLQRHRDTDVCFYLCFLLSEGRDGDAHQSPRECHTHITVLIINLSLDSPRMEVQLCSSVA